MGVQTEKEQPHFTEFGQCFLNKMSRSEGVGGVLGWGLIGGVLGWGFGGAE